MAVSPDVRVGVHVSLEVAALREDLAAELALVSLLLLAAAVEFGVGSERGA